MTRTTMPQAKAASGTLDAAFRPRGIAIVGASADVTTPGCQVLSNLLEAGYPGHLAVIDSGADSVLSVPAYPALHDVPGPVEMLILAAPAMAAPELVEAIGLRVRARKDLKVVVAIAGGFGQTDPADGLGWQSQLAEGCRAAGVRLVGPGCIGIIDNKNRVDTTFLTGVCRRPGGVSLLSRSGAMGAWAAMALGARPQPVGLNKMIGLGNMADVDLVDMMEYLGKDPSTRAVGLCLEGNSEASTLMDAAARVVARKPVVVLNPGQSPAGSNAALLHTGSLAAPDAIWDGVFRQFGLIRMQRLDDFIVTLHAFDKLPLPLGGRVSVLTNAGGPGVYALDALSNADGLTLARFSAATRSMLSRLLPPGASIGRPDGYVDMSGDVSAKMIAQSVAAALRDPGVDAVFHLFMPTRLTVAEEVAHELLALLPGIRRHGLDKPYFPVLLAGHGVAAARRLLEENGVLTLDSPDQAAAALAAMVRYSSDRQPPGMEAAASGGIR